MDEARKWYTNVYVILTVLISLLAVATSSLLFLLIPQSSEIIRLMQWRMVNAKTYYVQADATWSGSADQKDQQGILRSHQEAATFDTEGWRDMTQPHALRQRQKFDLKVGTDQPTEFAGENVVVGDATIFRFSEMPTRVGPLHFEEFRDKWLRVDLHKIFKDTELPLVGGEHPTLSDEDQAYLLEQFRITPFLKVKEKLKTETLGGVRTHHYSVVPEPLFFKDYYVLAETRRLGRELTNKERDDADVFFSNVTPDDGELWIGTNDYYLYRARLRFKYDDGARRGTFTLVANFSHFNEQALFDTPTVGVEDVTSVVASMLPGLKEHLPLAKAGSAHVVTDQGSGGGLPVDTTTSGDLDPDQDGLTNSLEKFYGTDPNNPDTDGNGIKDGDEVNSGCNPVGPGRLFNFGITDDVGNCK
jgi:hypothetical protein